MDSTGGSQRGDWSANGAVVREMDGLIDAKGVDSVEP
jgi:hypothetical protein